MKRISLLVTSLVLLLASCSHLQDTAEFETQAAGKTYYVSGTGQDSNTGLSTSAAFRTLQRAASLTQPGDTVQVMNGTYSKTETAKSLVLFIGRSGTPDAYITYKAYGSDKPVVKVSSNNVGGIQVRANYVVIDGFTVEGSAPTLSATEALRRAKLSNTEANRKLALEDPLFTSSGITVHGDSTQTPHHVTLRNNHVFNVPGGGMGAQNADYVTIENNLVHNNSYYAPNATSGISIYQPKDIDTSTATKMIIRNNTSYANENKVPFWYSNENSPSSRTITDGNGIIVDDARNTQGFGGGAGAAYKGAFDISNNVSYANGGRGINLFSSNNIVARYNTTYQNAKSSSVSSELQVGRATNVKVDNNIIVARPDRKLLGSFETSNVTFSNNVFNGGTSGSYPSGSGSSGSNLIKNGTFSTDLSNWGLSKPATAGVINNTRDATYARNCVYITDGNYANVYDVYLYQQGLPLTQGATYTLSFDTLTSTNKTVNFRAKLGGANSPYTTYGSQAFSATSSQSQTKSFTFQMTSATDSSARLELQLGANAAGSYFCFDNVTLTQAGGGSNKTTDAQLVAPSTSSATANFRLKSSSPARDAGTSPAPATDIVNVARPKGPAADIGAYESY